jgi:phospholipid/cholesterol/gamma-HCH transport system substrate-binding protein
MLKPGGLITHTEASVSLEGLIGKFMYSGGGDSKSGGASANGGAPAPAGTAPAPSSSSHP